LLCNLFPRTERKELSQSGFTAGWLKSIMAIYIRLHTSTRYML
jgi:hypothetical protein